MILIPAHNEEEAIQDVLEAVRQYAPKEEIVVVDSCCTDDTANIAKNFGATVIQASQKGYWNALTTGYSYALDKDTEYLIQLDGDGQHPAAAIPRLRHQLKQTEKTEKVDWVVGSRQNTGSYLPLERRFAQKIFSRVVEWKTGQYLGDISSGFWALNQRALRVLLDYPYQNGDVLIRVYGLQKGLNIKEISAPMQERKSGQSMHSRLTAGLYVVRLIQEWQHLNKQSV